MIAAKKSQNEVVAKITCNKKSKFPWSRILGDHNHVWKEKEKFIIACLYPP